MHHPQLALESNSLKSQNPLSQKENVVDPEKTSLFAMLPPRLCFAELDAISHVLLRVLCCGDGAATHWLLEAEEIDFDGLLSGVFQIVFVCFFVRSFACSSVGSMCCTCWFFEYMIVLKLVTSYSYSIRSGLTDISMVVVVLLHSV